MGVVVSCENGGSVIPAWLSDDDVARCPLRRVDPIARLIAHDVASLLGGVCVANNFDPRIANVSKSLTHRSVIPNAMKRHRQRIVDEIYQPFHDQLFDACLKTLLRQPFVIHLSIHTFDAVDRRGHCQRGDVGLSYDPKNTDQLDLTLDWIDQMYENAWMLKVRRNHPVAGTVENITHQMAQRIDHGYVGLNVHFNSNWVCRTGTIVDDAFGGMFAALAAVLHWSDAEAA